MSYHRPTYCVALDQINQQHAALVAQAEAHEAHFEAADDLIRLLEAMGHAGNARVELDTTAVTVVVFCDLAPADVIARLAGHWIVATMVDFADSVEYTTATFTVFFHGVELALVAHQPKPAMKRTALSRGVYGA